MGFIDKIKKVINNDNEYFGDVDSDEMDYDDSSSESLTTKFRQGRSERKTTAVNDGNPSTKVVDIHTTAKLQVVLKKPEHFDEASVIADELLEKRTVVLNLELTPKDVANKLLCFLSGVAYANGGKLKQIANNTYIITPYNVDVMGDLLDELESNGMFFV